MHISLGSLFNICENEGPSMHHLKNYGGFCVIPLNAFNYITIWQTVYNFVFRVSYFPFSKIGQRDLKKKNYIKICKKNIFQTSYKPPGRFQ